ncbi:MAG: flavin reductase family protein [Phycisphaerae bacterium]|nr:flavin reductase family protein [Phycisphaerae bacterium]
MVLGPVLPNPTLNSTVTAPQPVFIDPARLPASERYKLLIGGVVPRPIALVSSISPHGIPNLAPFSFFCGVGSNPMTVLFCPASKPDGSDKDTLRNVLPHPEGGTGEFVINVVSHAIGRPTAAAAEPLGYEESEFEFSGLTPVPSVNVRPPRVAESLLSFECVTRQVVRTNPGAPDSGNIVIGEVVGVCAAAGLINARHHIDPALLDAIGRMGGNTYCTTRERFDIPRGASALAPDRPN